MICKLTLRIALSAFIVTAPTSAQDDGKATLGSAGPTVGLQPEGGMSLNTTLLANWNRPGSAGYNDVWGWSAPDGREFAFVGEVAGIWFVETTDPNNLREIGWWSAPSSTWRDYTNLGPFVYAVSEAQRGIRVFDLTNPDTPQDKGITASAIISNTHNIRADPETGYLYLCGTNQGLAIFDTSASKVNPAFVGSWNGAYTHDACIRRGRAYLSNGRSLQMRIMDASNPTNLVEIGTCPTPGGYDHNVWISEDDQVACITDELSSNSSSPHMTVWDISNPIAPVQRGDYDLGVTVHNAYVIGRTCYMSHYTRGMEVVDLSDLTNPTRIANYDTSTSTAGFGGAWGCFPFTDSGRIFISDRDNGLYVFQLDCGHMNRYGQGTEGSAGVPRARFDGASPRVGATGLEIDVENLRPNTGCALLIGVAQTNLSVLGIDIHVDLNNVVIANFSSDANGRATVPLPIRNDPNMGNSRIYMQIVSVDSSGPGGFAASRGMWFGICP